MTPTIRKLSVAQAVAQGHDIADIEEFEIKEMKMRGCVINYEEGSGHLIVLHVWTRPEYRQQGRATRLVKSFIQHAGKIGKKIEWGTFTDEGELYLWPVIKKLTPDAERV